MKHISSQELRKARNNFWESKKHIYLPEASLVGGKESTAMFTIAGMQQLIPYLSGKKHPLGKRLYNIQKCVRTVDIDEVGDASHLTFFNMMWNRSLGDYFKKEAVQRSRDFLIDVLWFDPKKLSATVFEWDKEVGKDEETIGYRKDVGLDAERICALWAKDNRRSPGHHWPCGPCTEIFYRIGKWEPSKKSNPKSDEKNRLEVRNNVFMEYYRSEDGVLSKLPQQNVDTWMGFERMCKVLQGKETVYETDLFQPIIEIIEKHLKITYAGNEKRIRVIADHLRTSFFLINDGITPSNEGRGYVLRRLIRRMFYNLILLKELSQSESTKLIEEIMNRISNNFEGSFDIERPNHAVSQDAVELIPQERRVKNIISVLLKETTQFQKTISNGQKMLNELFEKNKKAGVIAWADAFKLYDSCGFPFELMLELANEKWFKVDQKEFNKEMEAQQERSRAGSKDMFKQWVDRSKYVQWMPPTKFLGYGNLHSENVKLLKDFEVNGQRVLIFDTTPLYGEWWGQMGDSGKVILEWGEELIIKDVKKYEGVFLHFVK